MMRKLLTEFIGTFFFVLVIGMVVTGGKGDFAPIAIGVALMCMIYAGGHISGGHYNPAVTLAVLIRGRITAKESIAYVIAQILGAILAAVVVNFFIGDRIPEVASEMPSESKALVAEFLGTFALAHVVLNVATSKDTTGNSFYGLSIGFTVLCMAYALGIVSVAAFNPAVAVGISLMHIAHWSEFWIFLVGCFGGAALAAAVFKITNPQDK